MRPCPVALVGCMLVTLLAACGGDGSGSGSLSVSQAARELHATNIQRYLYQFEPVSEQVNGDWTEYLYDPAKEEAVCFSGNRYQVNVRFGTVNKVLLYLEGGGACWDEGTCYVASIAKQSAGGAPPIGILAKNVDNNPFKDWSVVYAPYCDGSVFGGDNEILYGSRRTLHHGLQNVSAAITQMRKYFPNPDQILVAGSSAGGYGTFTGYAVTRVAYPRTPILILDDSGPGLQNPDDPVTAEARLSAWRFNELLPPSCDRCDEQITYLTEWALDRDPALRVGYFDYLQDAVLQFFLGMNGPEFEELLRAVTDDLRTRQPDRFKRFMPAGSRHTILLSAGFYQLAVDGITMRDWTAGLLEDGDSWQDVSD